MKRDSELLAWLRSQLSEATDSDEYDMMLELVKRYERVTMPTFVNVILFKPSGKFYTEEPWVIPENAIGPYDMINSTDFRRIEGGAVLIPSQEPWGFPHLFPNEKETER